MSLSEAEVFIGQQHLLRRLLETGKAKGPPTLPNICQRID